MSGYLTSKAIILPGNNDVRRLMNDSKNNMKSKHKVWKTLFDLNSGLLKAHSHEIIYKLTSFKEERSQSKIIGSCEVQSAFAV